MILDTHVEIKGNPSNISYYKNLGYDIQNNKPITIPINILPNSSHVIINTKCDFCDNITKSVYKNYYKITKKLTSPYYCIKCKYKKVEETNISKYGTKSNLSTPETIKKIKETNIKKYGKEHHTQSELFKDKVKLSNLEKYNKEHFFQTDFFKTKSDETKLSKYNTNNPMELQFIKDRMKKTLNDNIFKKYKKLLCDDYTILNYEKCNFNIKHKKCNTIFNIDIKKLYDRCRRKLGICSVCFPASEIKSIKEKELIIWLKELNIDLIESDKSILNPKHLDIYIPSKNLAIEFNGLYWHSDFKKDKKYHLNKSIKCVEKGIQLLHIWEDEWYYKQDIVKSIILNKLGLIKNKIFARKCEIRVVKDYNLIKKFLCENHIEGGSKSSIKLGLFHKNELVSLMTFKYKTKKELILVRYCNKNNFSVIGGASKIFKYLKNNYKFNKITTYSDFRLFDAKIYKILGFNKINLSPVNYYWCKNLERITNKNDKISVVKFRKLGYFKVFDCGKHFWEYVN